MLSGNGSEAEAVTSRLRRMRVAMASRGGKVLAVLVIALGVALLFLLSTASSNTPMFASSLPQLLLGGVCAVLVLLVFTGYQLLILRRRLKQRVFGSKLTMRLVLLFSLVAVLPGALVYAVSVQFLARSIDGWFDVRVEKALEGGLSLGRNVLDSMLRDLRGKAVTMAVSLSDRAPRDRINALNALREQAAVQEAAVISGSGQVLAFSGDDTTGLVPEMPSPAAMRDIRMQKSYSAIIARPEGGLLLRVVVPLNTPEGEVLALALVQRVTDQVASNAEAVRSASAEYQELSLSRLGLKRLFGLTLTLALLLALLSALLLAIFFSQRLSAPLGILAEGTRAVAQGDFSQRTAVRSYDELGLLTQSFNAMMRDLAVSQGQTERYQAQLEEAKTALESILGNLSAGVISLDADRRLRSANPSASRILGVNLERLVGHGVEEWRAADERLAAVAEPLSAALPTLLERDWQGQIAYPAAQGELTLLTRASQIAQTGPGVYVVVFDDVTRLLRAQRQAAWGEVARRLAHEIKNPLTPIQLSAERLQHRLHGKLDAMDGDMLSRLTQTIVNQVSALNSMVDAFSQYARSPEAELSPVDLGILTREVLGLYESMGWAMALSVEPRLPQVLGDATKLRQVLHNLLRNAEDAVGASSLPRISVRLGRFEGGVALSVTDNGNGFPPELMGSAFEPYVTTKPKGTGLGLAIVHKIVEEHHGTILLENIEPHGAKVTVVLPATAATARIGANTGSAAHG